VAQGKSPAAHKAMVHVAKAMAATGLAVLSDPVLMADAKAALAAQTARTPYISPLSEGVEPPLTMSKG
jgi:aminobenzoyl-glutamate utilization protein B